jgi:hypothetical protein
MCRKKQEAAKARYQEVKNRGDLLPFDSLAFESGKFPYDADSPAGKTGVLPEDAPPVVFTTKNGIRWAVADMDWTKLETPKKTKPVGHLPPTASPCGC